MPADRNKRRPWPGIMCTMIKILIIEDEEPASGRLERLLLEIEPTARILDKLDSVESAVRWLSDNDAPDLLMLDIQLADGLSFDIFRKVQIDSFVIFTTAYDEYAIRAFELNSIDYLLKPIDKQKLAISLNKFKKLSGPAQTINIRQLIDTLESRRNSYKKRFLVTAGARIRSVEVHEVSYFYSLEKSTYMTTSDGHHYPVEFSLERLEQLLEPDVFFRINRNYIINFSSIAKIHILSQSRIKVEVNPPAEEPLLVSTARTHNFRLWLDR
jgi:DNA-binding LytR/AlgR family response regulator